MDMDNENNGIGCKDIFWCDNFCKTILYTSALIFSHVVLSFSFLFFLEERAKISQITWQGEWAFSY
jgi:hypothetical protein